MGWKGLVEMSKFMKFLFGNIYYKFVALFLAVVAWYVVQTDEITEINRKAKAELVAPKGYVVTGKSKIYKDIKLRGPRNILQNFPVDPIYVQIPLKTDKPKNMRVRLDKEFFKNWDERIKITVYDPFISFFIDRKVHKELEIKANILGYPQKGFAIEKVISNPRKVVVSGADSELSVKESLATEFIDINKISQTQSFEIGFLLDNPNFEVFPKETKVTVHLVKEILEKQISNLKIKILNAPRRYNLSSKSISFTIEGPYAIVRNLSTKDFEVSLDLKDLNNGIHEKDINVTTPEGISVTHIDPPKVLVEVFRKK